MSAGKMSVSKMSVDKMSVSKLSVGQMSLSQMIFDQKIRNPQYSVKSHKIPLKDGSFDINPFYSSQMLTAPIS